MHSHFEQQRVGPSAGFIIGGKGPLKLQFDNGEEYGLGHSGWSPVLSAKIQYQINKEKAIQLLYEKNDRERVELSYILYW